MKLTLLSGVICLSAFAFAQNSNTQTVNNDSPVITEKKHKWHKARIFYQSQEQLALLAAQGVPLDHGKSKPGVYFESDFSDNELGIARMLGCEVEILIEDVSQFYKDQNLKENLEASPVIEKNASCIGGGTGSAPTYSTPSNWELGSMGGFYTYNEVLAELDAMVAQYPNLITAKAPITDANGNAYSTFEGRPIYWLKISDNPNTDEPEPEMLYDAIHHAREPGAMMQLVYYMWYLLENYGSNSEVQSIVDNTQLYFIPVLNPDGYNYNSVNDPNGGGMWRKNRRNHGNGDYGVDNNRNYNYTDPQGNDVWGTTGVSFQTGDDIYPGSAPFSEVENQAMKSFCEAHEFRIALNNHTYDNSLLYPFGYDNNQLTPEHSTYVAISDLMVQNHGEGMVAKISASLYPASGDSDDWQYGADLATKARIFSFTPEIGSTGFWPASNEIEDICNSMIWTNLTAAHLITNYSKTSDASAYTVNATSGHFKYDIQRLGLEDPANFTVSINPVSSNILSVGGSNAHNNMVMLQTDSDSISYTLSASIQAGDLIEYELLVDNGYFVESIPVSKIYGSGSPIFTDNANNLTNWDVSQTWNTTTQEYYSASSSITDSPNGEYNNNINKTITLSNSVDLTTALSATVSFYAKWEIEDNYDYVQFEVSTDGGNSWTPQCGNYTNNGTSDQDNGKPLYDGFQTTWVQEEINLSDYLGETILFRFQIRADQYVTEDGFYFDDLQVNVVNSNTDNVNENILSLSGYPNPTSDLFTINYQVDGDISNAELILTNNLGQKINTYSLSATSGNLTIDMKELPNGVYFYQISNGNVVSKTEKVIVNK